MKKIELIIGHAGEYSDYRTEVLEAWSNAGRALDRMRKLEEQYQESQNKIKKYWDDRQIEEERLNKESRYSRYSEKWFEYIRPKMRKWEKENFPYDVYELRNNDWTSFTIQTIELDKESPYEARVDSNRK